MLPQPRAANTTLTQNETQPPNHTLLQAGFPDPFSTQGQATFLKPTLTMSLPSLIPSAAPYFCQTLSGSFSWLPQTQRPLSHTSLPSVTHSSPHSWAGVRSCCAPVDASRPWLLLVHLLEHLSHSHLLGHFYASPGLTFSSRSPGRLPGPTSLGPGPLFSAARAPCASPIAPLALCRQEVVYLIYLTLSTVQPPTDIC